MGSFLLPCDIKTHVVGNIQHSTNKPVHSIKVLQRPWRHKLSPNEAVEASRPCFGPNEADSLCPEIKSAVPFSQEEKVFIAI
jgi:hypothetical protein